MTATDLADVVNARRALADGTGRALRIEAGVTLRQASEHIGVTAAALHRWEHGDVLPRGVYAAAYARFLADLRAALGVPA